MRHEGDWLQSEIECNRKRRRRETMRRHWWWQHQDLRSSWWTSDPLQNLLRFWKTFSNEQRKLWLETRWYFISFFSLTIKGRSDHHLSLFVASIITRTNFTDCQKAVLSLIDEKRKEIHSPFPPSLSLWGQWCVIFSLHPHLDIYFLLGLMKHLHSTRRRISKIQYVHVTCSPCFRFASP